MVIFKLILNIEKLILPDPGIMTLKTKHNHARVTGSTGIAPFITDE